MMILNSNLTSLKTPLIKTQTFSGNVNLPSKGEGNIDMGALSVPSGYTYIGVLPNYSDYGDQFLTSFKKYGSHIFCVVRNVYSTTLQGKVACTALFMKNNT